MFLDNDYTTEVNFSLGDQWRSMEIRDLMQSSNIFLKWFRYEVKISYNSISHTSHKICIGLHFLFLPVTAAE